MVSFGTYAVVTILIIFLALYRFEKITHTRRLRSIPIRIWVNGTRGKSSVTRLIAAGLRAGGKQVFAKTTGTSPRLIMVDGIEKHVSRLGMANISEQIRIVKKVQGYGPDAIVLECMALRPDLQQSESLQIVEPNMVVITNVRPDHLDVMGPTINDIARSFIQAVPDHCMVITSESKIFNRFDGEINKRNVQISTALDKEISNKDQEKFSYIEHKENIALALAVCRHYGIERQTALMGMQTMEPDPGALRKHVLQFGSNKVVMINAMAANDPESTLLIWAATEKKYSEINLLINCRDDRIDRSFQIADLIQKHMIADHIILTGKGTGVLRKQLQKKIKGKSEKIIDLGNKNPTQVVDEIANIITDNSLLFALGNTVGFGFMMLEEFLKHRSQ
ncbi:MAG: poly-gamma-glutamate synthase PgsB [bacterium]